MDDVYTYVFAMRRDSVWRVLQSAPKTKAAI